MLATANAHAEYTTDVRHAYSQRVQRVALAPVACPRDLDCSALEKALAQRLMDAGHSVESAAATRDLMARANVSDLGQFEQRLILAEGLRVDGFVIVNIMEAKVDAPAAVRTAGSSRFKQREGEKHAALELRMLGRDGSTLAEASGEADVGGQRNLQSVITGLFEAMLADVSKAQ